jgi:hypothetical protein
MWSTSSSTLKFKSYDEVGKLVEVGALKKTELERSLMYETNRGLDPKSLR